MTAWNDCRRPHLQRRSSWHEKHDDSARSVCVRPSVVCVFVKRLLSLCARVVHVPMGAHGVGSPKDALQAAVHYGAPQHVAELRHRWPDVVAQPSAVVFATLHPLPLCGRMQPLVDFRSNIVNWQRQEPRPEECRHLLVRQ